MKFSRLAILGAASLAVAKPHSHIHQHAARHGSPLKGRAYATTTTVPGPTVTSYELNGESIPWSEVGPGIAAGIYVIIEDEIDTAITPTSTSTTRTSTPIPTTSSSPAANSLEQKVSTSTTSSSTFVAPTSTTPTPTPTPTPNPTKESSVSQVVSYSSSSSSSATGIDIEFPSGKIDCTDFKSVAKYGAVAADWLDLGGFVGVQMTPSYSIDDTHIHYIASAGPGSSCVKNSFCSYSCGPGYQKAQWPRAQGINGDTIGGIYCNAEGKLERTRDGYKTLCMPGAGGVEVHSKLSKNVAICRTDYPGTESETDAINVAPGATVELTNPDAKTSFRSNSKATSAQYYVNPSGVSVEEGCQWGTQGSNMGNWAPVNIGVGTDSGTFIALFPNKPTNPDGVLDFNITITGDVHGDCSYQGGKFYSKGVEFPTGCTVAVTGTATFEFY